MISHLLFSAAQAQVLPIPELLEAVDDVFIARGQSEIDLASLSDEELVGMYIDAYAESIQTQTIDESRLSAKGRLLLQFGYSYGYDEDDFEFSYQQHTLPRLRLRYRVTDRIELRGGWTGFTFDRIEDELTGESMTDTRSIDPFFGVRVLLTDQKGWVPQSALTVTTPFDVDGDRSFLNRMNPQVSAGYSYRVHDQWFIYGSTGGVYVSEAGERFLDLQQSAGVSWICHDRWSLGLDWYGVFPEGARIDGMEHYLTPGIDFLLSPRTQIGVETSFGLNEISPDFVAQLRFTIQI